MLMGRLIGMTMCMSDYVTFSFLSVLLWFSLVDNLIIFYCICVNCHVIYCFGNLSCPWFRSAACGYLNAPIISVVCLISLGDRNICDFCSRFMN